MSDMRQTDESENKDEAVLESSAETPGDEDSPDSYGALKCYFYTPKRGDIRGAFCLVFAEDGTVLDDVFWATRDMTGIDIDVIAGWRTLNKSIPVMGAYEKSLGEKLNTTALDILVPDVRTELLQSDDLAKQLKELAEELCNAFERATHYFMEINLRLERLSRQDLIDARLLATDEEEETENPSNPQTEEEKSFQGTLITCLPIIDPVRGKPISELVPGDLVNVKIQGGVGAGDMIQKYLASMSQEAVFPVEAVAKKENDKIHVLLNISEEIHGLITVTKDLRLSVVQRAAVKKRIISFNTDNVIFFGTLAAAAVVILLAIRFLLF